MLTPDKFAETPVYDLLVAAAQGKVGMDQRWAHAIVDRGEAAVAEMVRFGTEDRSEDPIDLEIELLVMFQHLRSPAAVPFFVEYLRRHGDDVAEELPDAIFPIREAALEPLIQLYDEMEEDQSGEVAFLLASFRIRDERVLKILIERLEYDVLDSAIDLSLYGDPAAKPALEKFIAEVEDEHIKQQLTQTIKDIEGSEAVDEEHPFQIDDYFPERAGPEIDALEESEILAMLEGSDAEYRFWAATGLARREQSGAVVERLLDHAKNDPEVKVRTRCWESLAGIVDENELVRKAMTERLQDESVPLEERAGALVGLGQVSNEPPVRQFAEQFYENPETRAAALLSMWNSLDRDFAKYFPQHIDDPDPAIRKQAISGVGYLGIYEAAERLRKYFEDDEFRTGALFAYALSARAEVSPARMRSLLRRIEQFAGGFSEEEEELVKIALDERLLMHGKEPIFHADEERHHVHGPDCDHDHDPAPAAAPSGVNGKIGRNDPCPCGSGKKYKKCCGA